jgi:hypothetical protein
VPSEGRFLKFHRDVSARRTLQMPLNPEAEYDGGRLVFASAGGFECPPRPAGSVTVHGDAAAHGVTQMRAGVRYSLFLLHGGGEEDEGGGGGGQVHPPKEHVAAHRNGLMPHLPPRLLCAQHDYKALEQKRPDAG